VNNGIAQGVGLGAASITATVDGKTSAPETVSTVGTVNALQTANGLHALYAYAVARVKGITSMTANVSVTVGGIASTAASVGYTDANAPAATVSEGGAVYFLVPYGLKAGSQNLVLTINGATMPPYAVTVTDTNPFAVFVLDNNQVFVAELRQDVAPKTVANFVGLATGTKTYTDPCTNLSSNAPLYNGTTFFRCIPNFVFQGGDPLSKCLPVGSSQIGTGSIGFTIPFEVTGLTHQDGTLAMARGSDLNSASSQFFIDNGAQTELNTTLDASGNPTGGYVAFGRIAEGLAVAKAITITTDTSGNPLVPAKTPTTLTSLYITGKIDGP
jgi:peptidyl-prolyl cis-trans isomerase A (cyclophilin A)